jgi:hypothetical protein
VKIRRKQSQAASNGWHSAVCADVVDVGTKQTRFGPKEKVKVVHLIDERDEAGQPIRVNSFYNVSIHETSNFFKVVRAHTGSDPKVDAHGDFDTTGLIGLGCQIKTEQRISNKGTFANIVDMRPLAPSEPRVAIPLDFVRAKDGVNFPGN